MTWPGIVGNYRFYPFTQGYIYKKNMCWNSAGYKVLLEIVWLFSGILGFLKKELFKEMYSRYKL